MFEFHVIPHTISPNSIDDKIIRLVHPFDAFELKVLFVYGPNYTREMNIFFIPMSVRMAAASVLLFIFMASITLYIIRHRLRMTNIDFFSAVGDCCIPFIGGGNIQIEHRLERLFFAILLFGAFFIMSVFSGDLFECVTSFLNAKVSTFARLAEINPTIQLMPELYSYEDIIRQSLM